jgi:hypothetical protein
MKIKVVLASAAVVAVALVAFAFTPKKSDKKLISKTFYYINGTDDQRLETGFTSQSDPRQNTITSLNYTDVSNWSESLNNGAPYTSADGSSYVFALTISNWESAQDGDDDNQINLKEAVDAIFAQFSSSGVYPTSVTVDANSNGQSASVTTITKAESVY